MTRIVERAKALLPAALHAVVQARMEEGRAKYGQELDEWPGTPRRAAVMRLQELLDGINYALFEDDEDGARADAEQATRLLERWPDLTLEEMGVREATLPGASGLDPELLDQILQHGRLSDRTPEQVQEMVDRQVASSLRLMEPIPEHVARQESALLRQWWAARRALDAAEEGLRRAQNGGTGQAFADACAQDSRAEEAVAAHFASLSKVRA